MRPVRDIALFFRVLDEFFQNHLILRGQAVSPGIFEVFHLLGRAKAVERLRRGAAIATFDRSLPPGAPGMENAPARPTRGDRT